MKDEKFAPAALLCSLNYSRTDVLAPSLYITAGGGPVKAMPKLTKKLVLRAVQVEAAFHYFLLHSKGVYFSSFLPLSPSLPSLSLSFFFKLKAYVLKLSWPISFDSSLSFPVFLITGVKVNVFFILYNCFISYPMCNRQIKRLFNTNYESFINIGMKTFRRTVLLLGQYPLA